MDAPPGTTDYFTLDATSPAIGPAFLNNERTENFAMPAAQYGMHVQQARSSNSRDRDRGKDNRGSSKRHSSERSRSRSTRSRDRDDYSDSTTNYPTRSQDEDYDDYGDNRSRHREERGRSGRGRERRRSRERDRSWDRNRGRDRERSREKDSRRSRDNSRNRDYDRDHDRDRRSSRGSSSGGGSSNANMNLSPPEWREEIPNQTIMARGLPAHITEDDLKEEVKRFGLVPKDIRLLRKKDTGVSRGFAFVEFQLLSEAVRWKELTQGVLEFPGSQYKAALHYSIPKDSALLDRNINGRQDWNCAKCGVNNFRRRDYCFKCNSTREDGDASPYSEGSHEVSATPSNTLLFRNLDMLTTEERVLATLGVLTTLPIKSLKIAKDNQMGTSRGFCFVELHSTTEATQLHDTLLSMNGQFYIDGKEVLVSYTRRSLTSMNSIASANAASVALAAAQWTNQGMDYSYSQPPPPPQPHQPYRGKDGYHQSVATVANDPKPKLTIIEAKPQPAVSLGTVLIDGVTYNKYPIPDVSQYVYDDTSGYYYDASTGLYYDAASQYYYNSETQQYLYWDGINQTYFSAPSQTAAQSASGGGMSTGSDAASGAAATEDDNDKDEKKGKEGGAKQDKVKIAKKIAKDMERWAKTLNQKKEHAKTGVPLAQGMPLISIGGEPVIYSAPPVSFANSSGGGPSRQSATADAGFAILEKRTTPLERRALLTEVMKKKEEEEIGLVASYGGGDGSDSEDPDDANILDAIHAEENKLVDLSKMACLLCKRQFPSADVLRKHQQLSDLHKQNLTALRRSKLTAEELEELEKRERESGYRDRAKERRQKYGQPDPPKPNRLKDKYLKHLKQQQTIAFEEPTKEKIGSENIGNKMLKAMGWSEGQGLGRENQGRSGIIDVTRRVGAAGLGMKGSTYGATAKDSYKDAAKKAMQTRYTELDDP